MTINIYGKPQRTFHGNQYIGKTWRMFKTIIVGTWIGIKEMFFNPGKVILALLVLGLAFATFIDSSKPHRAYISTAWADLTSDEAPIHIATSTPETPEAPAVIMERIAKCESGGTHYKKDGTLVIGINTNKTIDIGRWQINSHWEDEARKLGMDIYLPEGNEAFVYWLYDNYGTEEWYASRECWRRK